MALLMQSALRVYLIWGSKSRGGPATAPLIPGPDCIEHTGKHLTSGVKGHARGESRGRPADTRFCFLLHKCTLDNCVVCGWGPGRTFPHTRRYLRHYGRWQSHVARLPQ